MGLMSMLGFFLGAGVLAFLVDIVGYLACYAALALFNGLCLLGTVLSFKEAPLQPQGGFHWMNFLKGLLQPWKHANFRWVFINRFLMVMGMYSVQEFIQYYMEDVVGSPYSLGSVQIQSTAAATGIFTLCLLLGAVLATLPSGKLSDRFGRKALMYIAGALEIVPMIMFTFVHTFWINMIMGFIFGLGYGCYVAVEWSLVADTLPSNEDHGRDMSLWHLSISIPQCVATPVGGAILDGLKPVGIARGQPALGYIVLFIVAAVYSTVGTAFIYPVKLSVVKKRTVDETDSTVTGQTTLLTDDALAADNVDEEEENSRL
eukprot:TRINITY_DN1184_c0_g1_i3.p1 TRINITY_DN1184_c0_g1~~TRINITY_DN1184_c0_g1_i3.p1  ORF type:complete len:317 (+),score=69.82 TRINITY_DN1184_c0_g1_i3:693-1643(+)